MKTPMVSVIIPSYNHKNFVARAIKSVLDQTYTDFELIISDDRSSDGSVEVIKSFTDQRIRAFFQEKNLGPVGAIDFLNGQAKGKYIALLNSDDYWESTKLEKQVEYMEKHDEVGVCYTQGVLVDENERILTELDVSYANIFIQKNRTQAEWLRYFFDNGNALSHMSILARKEIYASEFSLNPALRQVPDFDLWTRIVQKHQIHVIQEPLFFHRRLTGEIENTSAETDDNTIRGRIEMAYVLSNMVINMPGELFIDAFKDLLINPNAKTETEIKCEKYFILQKQEFYTLLEFQAKTYFMEQCKDRAFVDCMKNDYDYTLGKFYKYTGKSGFAKDGDLNCACCAFKQNLEAVEKSACWRITKPIRVILDLLKGRN